MVGTARRSTVRAATTRSSRCPIGSRRSSVISAIRCSCGVGGRGRRRPVGVRRGAIVCPGALAPAVSLALALAVSLHVILALDVIQVVVAVPERAMENETKA